MRILVALRRKPLTVSLLSLLIVDVILRTGDYFINKAMNPESERTLWNYSYSLKNFLPIPIVLILIVAFVISTISMFINPIGTDSERFAGVIVNVPGLIITIIMTLVSWSFISVALEWASNKSINYAISSLRNIPQMIVGLYCAWISFMLVYFFLNNSLGRGVFCVISLALMGVIVYRLISSCILEPISSKGLDGVAESVGADALAEVIPFLGILLTIAMNAIDYLCCFLTFMIFLAIKGSDMEGSAQKISFIAFVVSAAICVIGLTPIPNVIAFFVYGVSQTIG